MICCRLISRSATCVCPRFVQVIAKCSGPCTSHDIADSSKPGLLRPKTVARHSARWSPIWLPPRLRVVKPMFCSKTAARRSAPWSPIWLSLRSRVVKPVFRSKANARRSAPWSPIGWSGGRGSSSLCFPLTLRQDGLHPKCILFKPFRLDQLIDVVKTVLEINENSPPQPVDPTE